MIGCAGRAIRLPLAVAIVSGWVGLRATSAHAFVDFINESAVCGNANEVLGNFNDEANWVEFENGNCNKLCKKYSQECKSYIRKNALCAKAAVSDNASLDLKAICQPLSDKTEKKSCKSAVKSAKNAANSAIQSQKKSLLQACEDVQSNCVDVCENGLPAAN